MNKFLIALILLCFCITGGKAQTKSHSFVLQKDQFLLDGKPFQIISGEMHPARIPVEYWRHRIQMAKAMGCNTIAAYVFWNYHESKPGVFDFTTENKDIVKFLKIAQEEGMWVMLRPGPYVCAEWDFGGLPSYLLSYPDIKLRCMDSRYMEAVERYVTKLASLVSGLQVTKGGPIVMVQVENEYGSYANDKQYLNTLKDLWVKNGIEVPFYTADGASAPLLEAGTVNGAAIGLDPGANENDFAAAFKQNPDVPSFCSEIYPGWLTHWGEKWQRPDTTGILKDVRWLMDHKKSFNFYVVHGGTNFAFWAGANAFDRDQYQPDVTSYDYDAPVNEMGQPTPKYFALRNLLQKYLPKKQKLPQLPKSLPVIEIPEIQFGSFASLWNNLPEAKQSVQPKPMEMFGQDHGFILYRTQLIGHKRGTLTITDLHDYATVFVDGKYVGKIDRSKNEKSIELPASNSANPVLEILVEGMGRINFAQFLIDRKGITDRVALNGMTLMNWEVFNLPMDNQALEPMKYSSEQSSRPGVFFKAEFDLKETGDTYLDMSSWKKGVVWVNGHNLGRYWEIGPQTRLYCPAPWLKKGKNEIVIFDLHQTVPATVKGVKSL
ncbi:MAG: beta-galactosidase [Bacteroidota bacterium]|nr:beta-galactosidase [Bacteroidota bacterium]